MTTRKKRLIAAIGALAVLVVGAIIVYFAFIKSDAPPPLTLDSVATTTTVASSGSSGRAASTTTAAPATGATGSASTTTAAGAASVSNVDGTWKITNASQVGYRVVEDLVGGLANNVAVGRTSEVTGTVTIAGTKATAVSATADLRKLTSDSSRRDGQVQTRILNTAQFPTTTFALTAPIDFGSVPTVGADGKTSATGDLTIHGVTKRVTFDVTYRLVSATEIRMAGSVAIVWADYGIPSPTFAGVANVRDNGQMEFVLVATR